MSHRSTAIPKRTRHRASVHSARREKRAATLLLAALLCIAPVAADATTTVPLNTGYNHWLFQPYQVVTNPTSNTPDQYWINIASYLTTNPPIGPSWVLQVPSSAWAQPLPGPPQSHWISAWKTALNPAVPPFQYPAYTIFRKCFCLSPNFKKETATLSFQMRADDNFQVWFNSILNVARPPTPANHWPGAQIVSSLPSAPHWFKAGRNCIYVLLEDTGGHMGFTLSGTFQADGLAEQPALGPAQTFRCPCGDSIQGIQGMADADQHIISEIAHIAEERLASRNGLRLATSFAATPDAQWLSQRTGWWLRE
jgi:hypothetical protein